MWSVPEHQHRNQTTHDKFLIRCRSLLLEQDVQKHPKNVYKSSVSKKKNWVFFSILRITFELTVASERIHLINP